MCDFYSNLCWKFFFVLHLQALFEMLDLAALFQKEWTFKMLTAAIFSYLYIMFFLFYNLHFNVLLCITCIMYCNEITI